MPQIFGVDLLLSFPSSETSARTSIPTPTVTLLEFNASPDFFQSGDRLQTELKDMFSDVIGLVIAPFFNLQVIADEEEDNDAGVGSQAKANDTGTWVLIGEEKTRGSEW